MKIPSANGISGKTLYGAAQKQPPKAKKAAKVENTPQTSATIQEQLNRQKQMHVSFLTRARQSMRFYQSKIAEANQLIEQYQDYELEEFQQQVRQAEEAIPEFEAALEELQQSLNNGIEEHTFVLSGLEALLHDGGSFPLHTLEEYKKRREQEQDNAVEHTPRIRQYSLEELDKMIASLKSELQGADFSAKA